MFYPVRDRIRQEKESRRRNFLNQLPPVSDEEKGLGIQALDLLRKTVPEVGLAEALGALQDKGIEVRPNVWRESDTGVWVLNGIRFCRGEISVTTGRMRASRRFEPEGDLAFVPARDGEALFEMMSSFEQRRGRTPFGSKRRGPEFSACSPKRPKNDVPWRSPDDLPQGAEVYGLLLHEDGHRLPIVSFGHLENETFIMPGTVPVSPPWSLGGWLSFSEACVPRLVSAGGVGDPESVLMRGRGINPALRALIEKTNASQHQLDLFDYRMSVGRDGWSHVRAEDIEPLARAVCQQEEWERLLTLPKSRQRPAMRSIARGFDPVHAIGYEVARVDYLQRNRTVPRDAPGAAPSP